jgi:cellulose synthase/poly-beta-1,6-N-acetylglucosamine synthase-like glycosyltransferase
MMDHIPFDTLLYWIDIALFLIFIISVGYTLVFALASLRKMGRQYPEAKKQYRYCLLIPAPEGFDGNLLESVRSLDNMDYPGNLFDVVVSTNGLLPETKEALTTLHVTLLEQPASVSSPKALLEAAIKTLSSKDYDVLVLLNANNLVDPTYLTDINKAYHSGGMAIQTHKVSKKYPTHLSWLNALMEEVNNSLFRRGHVNLGFSSSLMGTGMAFEFDWFKQNAALKGNIDISKYLEAKLLKQGIFIEYLEHVYTYEDSVHNVAAYNKLRKEWSSTGADTRHYIVRDLPRALFAGNLDYGDKILQWMMPSKILLLGFLFIIAGLLSYYEPTLSVKWWIMTGTLLFAYVMAIPDKMLTFRTLWAVILLPILFLSVILNKLFTRSKR